MIIQGSKHAVILNNSVLFAARSLCYASSILCHFFSRAIILGYLNTYTGLKVPVVFFFATRGTAFYTKLRLAGDWQVRIKNLIHSFFLFFNALALHTSPYWPFSIPGGRFAVSSQPPSSIRRSIVFARATRHAAWNALSHLFLFPFSFLCGFGF